MWPNVAVENSSVVNGVWSQGLLDLLRNRIPGRISDLAIVNLKLLCKYLSVTTTSFSVSVYWTSIANKKVMSSFPHSDLHIGPTRTVVISGPHIQVIDSKFVIFVFCTRVYWMSQNWKYSQFDNQIWASSEGLSPKVGSDQMFCCGRSFLNPSNFWWGQKT